jgi:hypothetical protein
MPPKSRRSRYLGDPQASRKNPIPERKPGKLDHYAVFWKDLADHSKGTIWIYYSEELMIAGGLSNDQDIPFRLWGYRPSLLQSRGKKWSAFYLDEEKFDFLASPMATKKLMAGIVSRWPMPPLKLKAGIGPAFTLDHVKDEIFSYVYLVQLLTFHETTSSQCYYKIGKAKSIPKRIKQFGPCRLVAMIRFATEEESLRVESELHSKYDHYRRPNTEIFYLTDAELGLVTEEYSARQAKYMD